MTSTLRFAATICLFAFLAGCGGGSSSNNDTPTSSQPQNDTDNTDTPTPEPTTSKSITLSWTTPSSRANGDPLSPTEIGGYEVYYFKEDSQQGEGETLTITDPSANSVTTPKLATGTYYFAIASYDTTHLYSDISDYIDITIQ